VAACAVTLVAGATGCGIQGQQAAAPSKVVTVTATPSASASATPSASSDPTAASPSASASSGAAADGLMHIAEMAGGMRRDRAAEVRLKSQMDAAEQQFFSQAKDVRDVAAAVYDQNDAARGPKGPIVFLGATLSAPQDPAQFVASFSTQARQNGFDVVPLPMGETGVLGVCAEQYGKPKVAICAWASRDAMGEIVPTVPGWDSQKLGSILTAMHAGTQ
jgi:hypothetical protein